MLGVEVWMTNIPHSFRHLNAWSLSMLLGLDFESRNLPPLPVHLLCFVPVAQYVSSQLPVSAAIPATWDHASAPSRTLKLWVKTISLFLVVSGHGNWSQQQRGKKENRVQSKVGGTWATQETGGRERERERRVRKSRLFSSYFSFRIQFSVLLWGPSCLFPCSPLPCGVYLDSKGFHSRSRWESSQEKFYKNNNDTCLYILSGWNTYNWVWLIIKLRSETVNQCFLLFFPTFIAFKIA